jgi:hypothetical protein
MKKDKFEGISTEDLLGELGRRFDQASGDKRIVRVHGPGGI